ncbi:MAG: SDR family oxidoreductase, partial [Candidatus Delongbacteria bacterium]|nr:SDR family oxidoreductase [Candidatus Delongbacteria bacterium]
NNAGIQPPIGLLSDVSLEEWKRNIEINLFGTVHCCRAILPMMMEANYGKIINLSGGGSTSPRPNFSAYGVAKTAVVRFSETLAEEVRDYHIDVNAISPGAINTGMLNEVLQAGEMAGKEWDEARRRETAGGDDPNLAAQLCVFLLGHQSDGITGKLISARWDRWQEVDFRNQLRHDRHLATLRRIDQRNFTATSKS